MKRILLCAAAGLLLLTSCNKAIDDLIENQLSHSQKTSDFILYKIKQGEHYTVNNAYKQVELSQLKFMVRFDSSAIYETEVGINQYDINKLYGFSDNNQDHHQYSARFGWSWNENALRLYAYVYNEGKVIKKEMGIIDIGKEVQCSIEVDATQYHFTMDDAHLSIPRASTTSLAKGYLLYPYFGGDETAPHNINIWIKNL
jgi:hypothetical protein